jgi:signal transduction histidine kinase/ligand-binding sensor domain-containing protein
MRLGLLLVCWLGVYSTFAQVKPCLFDPKKPLTQTAIEQWTTDRGLFTNNLTGIIQASTGFLWITTYNGLIRFDGHSFELFDRDLIPFLKSDAFYRAYEDKLGTLWLATQASGIVTYREGKFKPFLPSNPQLPRSIRCLLFAANGDMWAGSNNNGLFLIRDSTVVAPPFEAVRDVSIFSMAQDKDQNLWIATNGNGVLKITPDNQTRHFTTKDGLPSDIINSVRCTPAGDVIVGTWKGLAYINNDKVTTSDFLIDTGIISIAIDDFGSIWLGTEKGLARINQKQNVMELIAPEQGLPTLEITSLFFDREGSLWLTASKGGLIRLKETGINTYSKMHGLSSDLVNIVSEGPDKRIYVGLDGGEIDVLTGGKASPLNLKNPLKGVSVRDLFIKPDGTLWIASYSGLIKKQREQEKLFNIDNGQLPVQDIRRIHFDRLDQLWLGTRSGGLLKLVNERVVETYNRKNGLSSNYILAIEEDEIGNIYAGTHGGGLSRIDREGGITTFHFSNDDSGILIFNLHIDESGAVWVVSNIGLYYFNGNDFQKIVLDHPTKGESYFDWIEDNTGNVWVTTNHGILKLRKEEVKNHINKNLDKVSSQLYNNYDGMKNKECTAATRSFKSSEGDIWVPTIGGISVVTPHELKPNQIEPPVYITTLVADEDTYTRFQPIVIKPGHLRYTIKFTSLSLLAPDKNRFKYILDGLEDTWTEATTAREVQYTNLAPGKYTLKVAGSNNDGIWSPTEAMLQFEVKPFFYQTTAFYLMLAVTIALVLFTIYKWRVHDIEKRNVELRKVNSELDKFVYSASHDLRAPLSSIMGLVNIARQDPEVANKDNYLNLIEKSVKKLDGFIKDIIDFSRNARMDVDRQEISFDNLIREVLDDLKYLDESNKILRLISVKGNGLFYGDAKRLKVILSNLISNAIKYHNLNTKSPFVEINVDYNDKIAVIKVIDNGSGIPEQHIDKIFKMFYRASDKSQGSGLGLYIVKETVERIKGKINVSSELGKGTTFEVTLNSIET